MPCDSIQLNRVDAGKMDKSLLPATDAEMESHGWKVAVRNHATGRTVYRNALGLTVIYTGTEYESADLSAEKLAEVRNKHAQAYSRQVLFAKAKMHGWKVRKVGANQYEVQR